LKPEVSPSRLSPGRLLRRDGDAASETAAIDRALLREPTLPSRGWELSLQQAGGVRESILRREARFREALALADVGAASLAVLAAVVMLGDGRLSAGWLLAIPVVVVLAKLVGLYDRDHDAIAKTTLDEAPTLLQVAMLYTLALTAGASIFFGGNLGAQQVLALCGLLFACLLVFRTVARSAVLRFSAPERCLIIADRRTSERIAGKLLGSRFVNVEVVAPAPTLPGAGTPADAIRSTAELQRIIAERDVHRVILGLSPEAAGQLDAIRLVGSVGVRVSLAPRLFEAVGHSVRLDDVDGLCLMGLPAFGLSRSSRIVKRCLDLTLATVGLVVLAPLLGAIAVAIKLETRGSVFFLQHRIGRQGRRFEMVKFRSMVDGADSQKAALAEHNEAGDGLFKLAADPRITRVGRHLRRLSLDELPQLFNVLRGEMSLVGPRPLVPEDDCHVEGWDRRRLAVPPGMTGVWQVLGSSRIPMEEMVKLDYLYAAHWSLWKDVKLLIRTLPLIYGAKGI